MGRIALVEITGAARSNPPGRRSPAEKRTLEAVPPKSSSVLDDAAQRALSGPHGRSRRPDRGRLQGADRDAGRRLRAVRPGPRAVERQAGPRHRARTPAGDRPPSTRADVRAAINAARARRGAGSGVMPALPLGRRAVIAPHDRRPGPLSGSAGPQRAGVRPRARPAPARPSWPSPTAPASLMRRARSTGWWSPARPSRPASGSGSCPAT